MRTAEVGVPCLPMVVPASCQGQRRLRLCPAAACLAFPVAVWPRWRLSILHPHQWWQPSTPGHAPLTSPALQPRPPLAQGGPLQPLPSALCTAEWTKPPGTKLSRADWAADKPYMVDLRASKIIWWDPGKLAGTRHGHVGRWRRQQRRQQQQQPVWHLPRTPHSRMDSAPSSKGSCWELRSLFVVMALRCRRRRPSPPPPPLSPGPLRPPWPAARRAAAASTMGATGRATRVRTSRLRARGTRLPSEAPTRLRSWAEAAAIPADGCAAAASSAAEGATGLPAAEQAGWQPLGRLAPAQPAGGLLPGLGWCRLRVLGCRWVLARGASGGGGAGTAWQQRRAGCPLLRRGGGARCRTFDGSQHCVLPCPCMLSGVSTSCSAVQSVHEFVAGHFCLPRARPGVWVCAWRLLHAWCSGACLAPASSPGLPSTLQCTAPPCSTCVLLRVSPARVCVQGSPASPQQRQLPGGWACSLAQQRVTILMRRVLLRPVC